VFPVAKPSDSRTQEALLAENASLRAQLAATSIPAAPARRRRRAVAG